MIYPIVLYGDPVLKKVAEDIPKGSEIKELVANMFETMYAASGVGLAAPQIGQSIRVFVIDDRPMMEKLVKTGVVRVVERTLAKGSGITAPFRT